MKYGFILFGALFGFLLSRAGATTPDNYIGLFLFDNLQLLWVLLTAVLVSMVGIQALKIINAKSVLTREPLTFVGKPMRTDLWGGAILFGVGWGMTGSCPGTAVAMLGEGKFAVLATVLGIIVGTYIYGLRETRRSERNINCDRTF